MAVSRIQLRRGTAAEWADADPVLAQGEPGVETDTRVLRIGDGVTPWHLLAPQTRYVTQAELNTAVAGVADFVPRSSAPLYLSDFAPRGGTDSASAGMRAALDELGARGGGELVVDGTFLLDEPSWAPGAAGAAKAFGGLANSVVIRGYGSDSVLVLRGPSTGIMLHIAGLEMLTFQDVTFFGSPQPTPVALPQNIVPDCRKGIYVESVRSAVFNQCYFVGLVTGSVGEGDAASKGAVIHAYDASLVLRDCIFSGCGGTIAGSWGGAHDTPVVRVERFGGLIAENCRWMDVVAGGFKGAPQSFRRHASAWVKIEDPFYSPSGVRGHTVRAVTLRNCHFDEAVASAVHVRNSLLSDRVRSLRIESCGISTPSNSVMNAGANKAAPLLVNGVDEVTVLDSFFGDFGSLSNAMQFEDCDHVSVVAPFGAAPVTTITADDQCGTLSVRRMRGSLTQVDSAAAVTDTDL